jgi:hypothetical protein
VLSPRPLVRARDGTEQNRDFNFPSHFASVFASPADVCDWASVASTLDKKPGSRNFRTFEDSLRRREGVLGTAL